jgi:hypothetical protein
MTLNTTATESANTAGFTDEDIARLNAALEAGNVEFVQIDDEEEIDDASGDREFLN